ncbi:hypothetical protein HYDPIDRAFT_85409 [Hydnomerulius pinastri MD-312]|nr:hypothetical protein HYDPIDRAFT_85409 [Hydnomerulius pinastri MD-312]
MKPRDGVSSSPTTTDTQTNTTAIDTLRAFLSPNNVTSSCPHIYTPNTIRSFYYSAESRDQLGKLDSNMLSVLISLFGSLSIDPPRSLVYRVPLASHLVGDSVKRSHWAFVVKLGKYKQQSGMTLGDSDRFWLMRAELANAQALIDTAPRNTLPEEAIRAISRARTQHHIIRRHSRHPEVHVPYLLMLLTTRDPRHLDFAAQDLAFLLRTHSTCHPKLLDVLYCLVLQHGAHLSTKSQDAIVSAVWNRARQVASESHSDPDIGNQRTERLDNCPNPLDATSLARILSADLFSSKGGQSPSQTSGSMNHFFAVFSPAHTLPQRWMALILLALFNASETCSPNVALRSAVVEHSRSIAASCWEVTYGLATIEKVLRDQSTSPSEASLPMESVRDTALALHRTWMPIMEARVAPPYITCAVLASFFRLASVLADGSLLDVCGGLVDLRSGFGAHHDPADGFMTAQYLAASLRAHGAKQDMVFRTLKGFSDIPRQSEVLTLAVEALAPIEPSLAHTLYDITLRGRRQITPEATHTLAVSLAQRGALDHATRFLEDDRFSLEQLGTLVAAITGRLREDKTIRHRRILTPLADKLVALYRSHSPPEHFRGHLEELLVILCQYGKVSQAIRVVTSVLRESPSYFQLRFYTRCTVVLLRQRQFNAAAKLPMILITAHPRVARRLGVVVLRAVIQARALRVAQRARMHSTSSTRRILSRLLDTSDALRGVLRGPTSLQLSSFLRRSNYDGSALEFMMEELLSSGRVLAAKHAFARASPAISSKRCTALGNLLLHGVSRQPTPRNGRRVRKILTLLEELVKKHGFKPDRVTVNIMLKTMVTWWSMFDHRRLRALFDQLVRGGYPAAEFTPQRPPFGTPPRPSPNSLGFSKLASFISFERHSRPLYKTFIKAFYLRGDIEAARKVVRILKVEEHRHAMVKGTRARARIRGNSKASSG